MSPPDEQLFDDASEITSGSESDEDSEFNDWIETRCEQLRLDDRVPESVLRATMHVARANREIGLY